jgi:predicted amidophosphoribosyltransferase
MKHNDDKHCPNCGKAFDKLPKSGGIIRLRFCGRCGYQTNTNIPQIDFAPNQKVAISKYLWIFILVLTFCTLPFFPAGHIYLAIPLFILVYIVVNALVWFVMWFIYKPCPKCNSPYNYKENVYCSNCGQKFEKKSTPK